MNEYDLREAFLAGYAFGLTESGMKMDAINKRRRKAIMNYNEWYYELQKEKMNNMKEFLKNRLGFDPFEDIGK